MRALVSSVGNYHGAGLSPSLVFATGDVGAFGKPGEYEIATRFFDDLLDAVGLDRKDLFVVPGNHDVDRSQGVGLARSLSSREESDEYFAPSSAMPHLTLKLGAFREWYAEFFAGIRDCPASSCGPAELVELSGRRIAILPINSALFCQDDDDHAKLWIGRRALGRELETLDKLDADLRVALVHHPTEWLADTERANVRATLAESVDIVLRGHLHETEIEQVVSRNGSLLNMAAGAAYQTRRWPNRALYVTVDDSSLSVFPIRYEDSPKEVWTVDPSVFPDDDRYTGIFDLSVSVPARGAGSGGSMAARGLQPLQRFRSNVPSTRGLQVVGREAELQQMAAIFGEAKHEHVLVLTGAPGVGKSELAREFARQNVDRYPGGTFLIDATNADVLVDLVHVASNVLGMEFPNTLKVEDQCLRALLSLGTAPTLLIYDNARSCSVVERWLPPAGMPCHVIVTTVHEPAAPGWQALHVDALSIEKSEELVAAVAGAEVAEKYGATLATHAGGLPVELCPMAALVAYEERRGRSGEARLSSLADETQASFSLVYGFLEQSVRLFLHAALSLNPQRISRVELSGDLKAAGGWTDVEVNRALDVCRDVHLLEGDEQLRMHQLWASYLESVELPADLDTTLRAIQSRQRERLATVASALVENPADGQLAIDVLGFRLSPGEWERMDAAFSAELRAPLAAALVGIGEFEQARPWFEAAAEEGRQGDVHGRVDHASLGVSLHQVGYTYAELGEFEQARIWFEEAADAKRQGDVDGHVDHASLGSSLNQVGDTHAKLGEFEQARTWLEEAVEAKRQGDVHGRVDHASLGISLNQVGYTYSALGEFEQARPWLEESVEAKRQGDVDGRVDHESLSSSLHQVGFMYAELGEFEQARRWFEEAAEEGRQGDIHGRVDHASLGSSLHQVGFVYAELGEFEQARPWFEEAAEEGRQGDVHGRVDHASLGRSLHQVGYTHAARGEFEQARPWLEEAVEAKRQGDVHGRIDHTSLGASLHHIGYTHAARGEFEQARTWLEEAVEEGRQGDVYGRPDHVSLGSSLRQGAEVFRKLGDGDRAAQWESEAQNLRSSGP